MKLSVLSKAALLTFASAAGVAALAQTAGDAPSSTGLNIPADARFLTNDDPSIRKANAIVNGEIITGTDIDQRLALVVLANGGQVPPEELQRLREQVLRNLVDETLQIQAAASKEIKVEPKEIDAYYAQYAKNLNRSVPEFAEFLKKNGSSERTVKRQIQGELAWRRLQGREIEPFVNVGEEEVRSIIERLQASKGTQEFRIAEIFLSATPETAAETRANADRIVEQIRGGASFVAYARQFSEASTAVVGGDLGWVRANQLPDPLAQAAQALPVGQVSDPIAVPGGFSVIAVQDTRQILTADPRDSVLSLKQLSVTFAPGTSQAQAGAKIEQLAATSQSINGCGSVEAAASALGAEVITRDEMKVRELPPMLQDMLLKMSIGQATRPFGSLEDGVRVLVLCGRDDPVETDGPSAAQITAQLEEERINLRARRYLRDLRRDAIVEYR